MKSKTKPFVFAVLLILTTCLAYSNTFSAGFTLDNKGLLLEDPRIRGATPENIGLILHHSYWWPRGEAGLYRPVTTLSYLFNYAVLGNGEQPAGYHWINSLLQLANVLLVFVLSRRLIRDDLASFFIAALWAVHPLLTESVTNMIGRSDLMAGFAILSGLWMYLKSKESRAWLAGLMAVTFVGVFSKESAVAILGVIALYELAWWEKGKSGRALLRGSVAVSIPIGVMLYQRFIVLSSAPPAELPFTDNPLVGAGFWTGRLTAIRLIGRYLLLTFWPATLSTDYSYAQIPVFQGSIGDWAAIAFVLVFIGAAVVSYWWNRTAFFLIWFTALTFLPSSNLLFPIGTIMAERFMYLSTIGLLGCLVLLIFPSPSGRGRGEGLSIRRDSGSHPPRVFAARRPLPKGEVWAIVLLTLLVLAFGIRTWFRNQDWQDQRSIVEANLRAAPNSFKVHMVAAELYAGEGPDHDLERAIAESEKSMAILHGLPDSLNTPLVYRNAGGEYLAKDNYPRALEVLLRSSGIDKATREAYDLNGGAEWAGRHATAALGTKADPDISWMLAVAYQKLGKTEQGLTGATQALTLHPSNPGAYRQLADVFTAAHRPDDAATALFEGLLMTSDPSLRSDLVRLYRTSADAGSCALANSPSGLSLNLACDGVRRSLCPASVEVVKAAIDRSLLDAARKLKETSLRDYGCLAEPFNRILP